MKPDFSTEVLTAESETFFDFEKARVQGITLDELQRTHKENDVYGKPIKGIYHYQLIFQILEMCKEFGYTPEVYDMFAAQNKDRNQPGVVRLPQIEEVKGERAVEAHILRRVFANIRLVDMDDDELTTNLAVAFHQKGIQVGFGNMVKICHNQCMLGADNYAATYSEQGQGRGKGLSIEELLSKVRMWLTDARTIIIKEREKIERMKSIQVPAESTFQLIGYMTALRVKADSLNKEIRSSEVYPLNQGQISKFTEDMLLRYKQNDKITVWDVYNAATDLYKANSMDIPQMLVQNRACVAVLDEFYNI